MAKAKAICYSFRRWAIRKPDGKLETEIFVKPKKPLIWMTKDDAVLDMLGAHDVVVPILVTVQEVVPKPRRKKS